MLDNTALKDLLSKETVSPADRGGVFVHLEQSGVNPKLHAVTDANGRPIRFFIGREPTAVWQC